MPDIRKIVAKTDRLTLVRRYQRAKDDKIRKEIVDICLRQRAFINNWDLVDGSARDILGPWLIPRSRAILTKLAKSRNVWDRRIARFSSYPRTHPISTRLTKCGVNSKNTKITVYSGAV